MADLNSVPCMKGQWWLSSRTLAEKQVKKAQHLLRSKESADIFSAINLLDEALRLWPKCDKALELKARALLYVRRFKDVANMLEEYIPSISLLIDPSEGHPASREDIDLISSYTAVSCSLTKVLFRYILDHKLKDLQSTALSKKSEREAWKYLVLGQACFHLGMMEDAMILLQIGKRAASAAFRHESVRKADDSFSSETCTSESEIVAHLIGNIKLFLRRRAAGLAALDAGHYLDSARHFSKILDGKKGTPQAFIAECYMYRATAYKASGRLADAIADCNRTLALDPTCIEALTTRASLFESIRCYTESLQDLEHLKMLYESILRNQRQPGPLWKQRAAKYTDIEGNLERLKCQINDTLRSLFGPCTTDYYALLSLKKDSCTRADVECAHRLLSLRHRPDKAFNFVDRCDFADDRDIESIKDQARMSATILYRMLQKASTSIMASIAGEETGKPKIRAANEVRGIDSEAQMVDVSKKTSWDRRGNSNQGYCNAKSEIHTGMLSSDPKVVESSHELKKASPRAISATNMAFKGSSEVASSRKNGLCRKSILIETPDFGLYNSVKDDAMPSEFLDSGLFKASSCRDMIGVGTMLSRTLHQGRKITPLEAI